MVENASAAGPRGFWAPACFVHLSPSALLPSKHDAPAALHLPPLPLCDARADGPPAGGVRV